MHDVGNRQAHRRWWRSLAWVPGLLVLLTLISLVGRIGEQERLLALVERSQPAWLIAAAALQAATYFSAAGVWQRVLWKAGIPEASGGKDLVREEPRHRERRQRGSPPGGSDTFPP